jgi:hypothetical protein
MVEALETLEALAVRTMGDLLYKVAQHRGRKEIYFCLLVWYLELSQ